MIELFLQLIEIEIQTTADLYSKKVKKKENVCLTLLTLE